MVPHLFSVIVTLSTWLAATGFILAYTWLAPWWATAFGRMIVFLDTALAVALLPACLNLVFNVSISQSPFWAWTTTLAVFSIPFTIVYRIAWLWRLQDATYRARNQRVIRGIRVAARKIGEMVYPQAARGLPEPPDPHIQVHRGGPER